MQRGKGRVVVCMVPPASDPPLLTHPHASHGVTASSHVQIDRGGDGEAQLQAAEAHCKHPLRQVPDSSLQGVASCAAESCTDASPARRNWRCSLTALVARGLPAQCTPRGIARGTRHLTQHLCLRSTTRTATASSSSAGTSASPRTLPTATCTAPRAGSSLRARPWSGAYLPTRSSGARCL